MAKKQRYNTPAGVAVYPHLNRPDTKYKSDGEFHVKLALEGEAAEKLKEQVDAHVEEAWNEKIKSVKPQKKKSVERHFPYEPEFDEDGEPTGRTLFKFKQNAIIRPEGKAPIEVKLPLVDAKGKPCPGAKVGGGSVIKVGYTTRPYYAAKDNIIGATLDLGIVKILELVEWGGGASADAWGMGDEEDGFSADDGYDASDDSTGGTTASDDDDPGYDAEDDAEGDF